MASSRLNRIGVPHTCERCGAEFKAWPSDKRRFCSKSCATRSRSFKKGRDAAAYRGGVFIHKPSGRAYVLCRDRSVVAYYRAVMEGHLRRELGPDEHVHHINGDCSDDRLENLRVISPREHAYLHIENILKAQRRSVEVRLEAKAA